MKLPPNFVEPLVQSPDLQQDESDAGVLEGGLYGHGDDLRPGQAEHPGQPRPEHVARDGDGEAGHHHGGGHQQEDEEVDVDAGGEDEEHGQEGEGHDDALHEPGGAGPAPAHPHAQRGGQDQHQQRDDQLLEGHHQLVARQQGACRGYR